MADRWQFAKVGMGYRCWSDSLQTEFKFSHVRRSHGEIVGTLKISCNFEKVKTVNGVLHQAGFNILSSSTRSSLAKTLTTRTPGFDDMDWFDGLEWLCQGVIEAEDQGGEMKEVGMEPATLERDRWMVEPLIVRGQPSLLFGPGGSGKSNIALACGLSVAAGREIIPGIAPAVKGPVLYLDWETSYEVVNTRALAIAQGHGFVVKDLHYQRGARPLVNDVEDIAGKVSKWGIVLVIVDSAEYAKGAQNEFGDANESVLRMHEALSIIGATSLIVDHVNKTDARAKAGTSSPYGSAFKRNAARVSWEIRKEPCLDGLRTSLYHNKENDGREREPMGVSMRWQDDGVVFGRFPVGDEPNAPQVGTTEAAILELLDGAEMEIGRVVATLSGFKEDTVRKTMYRMYDRGILAKTDRGRYHRAIGG